MRDYRVSENPLITMETIANNHKIDLHIEKMKNGKLSCSDDEGNVWIGLPKILGFYNEFIMDGSLCTLEQIMQVEKLWVQEQGKYASFPLNWLKNSFILDTETVTKKKLKGKVFVEITFEFDTKTNELIQQCNSIEDVRGVVNQSANIFKDCDCHSITSVCAYSKD